MNETLFWGVAWLLLTLLVFALPLWPAWRELRDGTDISPLPIDSLDDGRTSYRARAVVSYLSPLEALPPDKRWPQTGDCSALVREPLIMYAGERAKRVVSSSDVVLQKGSLVTRALHARRLLSEGSQLPPRASADDIIMLAPGTVFLRLNAPLIQTLDANANAETGLSETTDFPPFATDAERHSTSTHEPVTQRHFHAEDLTVHAGEHLVANLVVRGDLILQEGARITGHVKVHGNAHLARQARLNGALFVTGSVDFAEDNWAQGPVCAGQDVHLGKGFQGGSASQQCSISGWKVRMAAGVRVHGSVATLSSGEVLA